MINWNEVTVGETELCKGDKRMFVLAMDFPWIWCKYMLAHKTLHKDHFHDWTIYDPWEDVSEECTISPCGTVMYEGAVISFFDFQCGKFKRSEKGLRVWKRKEN